MHPKRSVLRLLVWLLGSDVAVGDVTRDGGSSHEFAVVEHVA